MKRYIFSLFLGLIMMGLSAGSCLAYQSDQTKTPAPPSTAPQQGPANTPTFRPGSGTIILAALSKSLDVKKLSTGALVEGIVFQDLLYKGKVVIPRDAKVIGHVTEATPSTKEHPQSRLGILFDKIVLKDKRELPFQYPAMIVGLAAPISWSQVSTTKMQDMPVKMEKGIDTGGAAVEAIVANPNLAGANMRSTGTGAINAGNRGVTGIKGLSLVGNTPETAAIESVKGDVKLIFETQLVLLVSEAPARQIKSK